MKRGILIFMMLGLSTTSFSQTKNQIGFSCGFAGSPTQAVLEMEELIQTQSIDSITAMLYSEDVVDMVLAKVTLEYFLRNAEWQIGYRFQQRMHDIERVNFEVPYCSGCTPPQQVFRVSDLDPMRCEVLLCSQLQHWLDQQYAGLRD